MGQSITIPSAAITVYVDNQIIGFATTISYNRDLGIKTIYAIDDPTPQEIAITGPYTITGSLSGFAVISSQDHNRLLVHANTISEYFNQKYATIEVKNRTNSTVQFKITNCIFHSDSWSTEAKGIGQWRASFTGMFLQPISNQ